MNNSASNLLSICIPTYNRCEMLIDCIKDTIEKVGKYNISIIVSDNNSSDNTKIAVEELSGQYPYLLYYRQESNIGADRNFEFCLKQSKTAYCWLLGDSYRIDINEIDNILNILKDEKYCVMINNSACRVKDIPLGEYNNPDKLLYDLGWHMTIMCSLIFHKKLIAADNFERYYDTNFLQNGIIFEYMALNKDAVVYWYNNNCIYPSSIIKRESWMNRRWQIFGICWTNYVMSLPYSISMETKVKCIREHNRKMHLFTIRKIMTLKINNSLNREILKKSKYHLQYFWGIPYFIPYLICITPNFLLKPFRHRNM